MFTPILSAYGLSDTECTVTAFGTGLINNTWKVICGRKEFILQRINTQVFKDPAAIAENLRIIGNYLAEHQPSYLFVRPVKTVTGEEMIYHEGSYYRLLPFIKNSVTYDVVPAPGIAYEAARQFGRFTSNLAAMDASRLHVTLPDFHNLSLRYVQFRESLVNGNPARIQRAAAAIGQIQSEDHIVKTYERIRNDAAFRLRVTHHDTKISNVLFDEQQHGLCVIDLDTTMQGYFISDVGDMLRTYLSPASEEEHDHSRIEIRDEYFQAIADGYLGQMRDQLSAQETEYFLYAGEFMIYMQAVRFLTDYFNDDIYYGKRYDDHNFKRAENQLMLLRRFQEKRSVLRRLTKTH